MRKAPDHLPSLDLLVTFEAAARHLSFTKAGAELFVTQSAISRQVKTLEEELGVVLFQRRHRRIELTDDGRRLHQIFASLLVQLRSTVARLRVPNVRESLSVTTTPGVASLWLIPRLALFTKAHPGIDVRIDASLNRRELTAEGFDVAIRYGRAGAAQGIPLGRESMQPVCSPGLARDRGRPLAKPEDLRGHTLLQVVVPPGTDMPFEWDPWLQGVGLPELQPAATLTFSNYDEAITAALEGHGVALGRRPLIDHLIRSRKLVTPFKTRIASPRAYYLVTAPGARTRPAAQAFESWILEQVRTRT